MQSNEINQRRDDRFDTELQMRIAEQEAVTQNVSRGGVYFQCDSPQEVGSLVSFTVEYMAGGEKRRLACEGQVVRVQKDGERYGIATRLVTPFFTVEQASA